MTDGGDRDQPVITGAPFEVEQDRAPDLRPELGEADPMITEVPTVDLVEGPAVSGLPMTQQSDRPAGWWRLMFGRSRGHSDPGHAQEDSGSEQGPEPLAP